MKIRVDGIDEVQKNLEKILNKAKEIEESNQVTLTELLPDSLIKNIQTSKLHRILLMLAKNC